MTILISRKKNDAIKLVARLYLSQLMLHRSVKKKACNTGSVVMRSTKAWTSARLTVFLFWNELAGEGHGSKTAMDGTKCQITHRSK